MSQYSAPKQVPIAVVGVSALFPGSADVTSFWRNVLAGRDLLSDVPASHWLIEDYYDPDPAKPDKTYGKRGGFLPAVDFDPLAFGVPPSNVPATDTAQLLALIVAQKVLEDATRGQFAQLNRDRVSVVLGVCGAQELVTELVGRLQRPVWLKALREAGLEETQAQQICERIAAHYVPWQEASFPGLLGNVVAGRIANKFDLHGTNCVTDAACASALSALSVAINELAVGQSDLVITGGVDTMNDPFTYLCFSKTPALSPSGDCRPFADNADGTMLGEGLAMLALKRLADAERDGDQVYAVIRGVGSSSDGQGTAIYAPLSKGQARALRRAYAAAGYGPETVELVEAHGTGTKAGDVAEFDGLRAVFEASGRADRQWCALGSIKSQIGHTKAAAGAAGLLKVVLALHHKVLPPTIKIEQPNPKLEIDATPFYLNTRARPWIRAGAHPRRASVSSFGFGGSNFHAAVEEYVGAAGRSESEPLSAATETAGALPAPLVRSLPSELVLLHAGTASELVARARALADEQRALALVAHASQRAYQPQAPVRLALVATDTADLARKLAQASAAIDKAPQHAFSLPAGIHYQAAAPDAGSVALLFSGQGSQYVDMGADLALHYAAARAVWDAAAAQRFDGKTVPHIVFPPPAFTDAARAQQQAQLTATEWAQPALAAQSLAQLALLRALGVQAHAVAGHSFGELVALHYAGVFDAGALLRLARKRGELMRDAAAHSAGAMLAIARPLSEVTALLAERADAEVVVANHNGPEQVVVSGTARGIDALEQACGARGLAAKRLNVAAAFHSPLVAPAVAPLREFVQSLGVQAPLLDVYGNTHAEPYPPCPAAVCTQLAEQLAQPVRFVDSIEAMYARGVRVFIEVGAGHTLTDLTDRILAGRAHVALSLDRKGKHGVTALHEALARLAVSGVPMDYAALWAGYALPAEAPVKKAALTLKISGTNYGKPYPPPGGAAQLPPPNGAPASTRATPQIAAPSSQTRAQTSAPAAPRDIDPLRVTRHPPADVHMAWLGAFEETQRHTVDAHAAFQRELAESHRAFLKMVETTAAAFETMLLGRAGPADDARRARSASHDEHPLTETSHDPSPEALSSAALQEAPPTPAALTAAAPASVPPLEALRVGVPAASTAAASGASGALLAQPADSADLETRVLAVIADKTGYPAAMLSTQMELETDLGIDSIKRVEILSYLRETQPGLADLQPAELGKLRTIGDIVARLQAFDASAAADATSATEAHATPAATARAAAPATAAASTAAAPANLEQLVLAVVADKTGYPVDMLTPQMELEVDLGIDSIKRVEILSVLRERVPGLPELKPSELGKLRTIGEIAAHLNGGAAPAAASPPAPVPSATSAPPAQQTATTLSRAVLRVRPERAPGLALPGLSSGPLAIVDDGTGVAPRVAQRLGTLALEAHVVTAATDQHAGVILLGGLRTDATPAQADAVARTAFAAAQTVAGRLQQHGGVFVTVQDTGGDFGLSGRAGGRCWLGGLAALARTAAREWPHASVKAIDCEQAGRSADDVAAAIVHELLNGGSTHDVGLRADGARLVPQLEPSSLDTVPIAPLARGDVIVATGGGRGVTAAALLALARAHAPRFVLLGRTPLEDEPPALAHAADAPTLKRVLLELALAAGDTTAPAKIGAAAARVLAARAIRATLAALQAAGAAARYVPVDVQDRAALSAALERVRSEWGPIHGVVHAAGVLADRRIADKTAEQFARVYDTKVGGVRALLDATGHDPLKLICLFSSVAARTGNAGQCDYAMANEVLNHVAATQQIERPACLVRAIAWGAWDGGMVDAALADHFRAQGVGLIPLAAGAQAFVDELERGRDTAQVVIAAGALSAHGASSAPRSAVRVHPSSHPHLADHTIEGAIVVPMALAIEWLLRAATQSEGADSLAPPLLRELRVLRKIGADSFTHGALDLQIDHAANDTAGAAGTTLQLRSIHGVHYCARAVAGPPAAALHWQVPAALGTLARAMIYDGRVLFHGPRFQSLRSVEGIGTQGAAGMLAGVHGLGWKLEPWCTDPGLVDGALQLGVLWAERVLGHATLPMAIDELRLHQPGAAASLVRAIVRARTAYDTRALCDIGLVDHDGALRMELMGVELVLRPDLLDARAMENAQIAAVAH